MPQRRGVGPMLDRTVEASRVAGMVMQFLAVVALGCFLSWKIRGSGFENMAKLDFTYALKGARRLAQGRRIDHRCKEMQIFWFLISNWVHYAMCRHCIIFPSPITPC